MRRITAQEWSRLIEPPPSPSSTTRAPLIKRPGEWWFMREDEIPTDVDGLEIRPMRGVYARWVGKS